MLAVMGSCEARGSAGLSAGLADPGDVARKPDVILGRWRELGFVLVEVERGVEFGLAHGQFCHSRFVIEGLVGSRLIIGEGFAQTEPERKAPALEREVRR